MTDDISLISKEEYHEALDLKIMLILATEKVSYENFVKIYQINYLDEGFSKRLRRRFEELREKYKPQNTEKQKS